jgi:acyl carrier protein
MPSDSPLVKGQPLSDVVQQLVADVLVISLNEVQPGRALIRDLGAESIDLMDLVFQLEDALDTRIPFTRWQQFVEVNLAGRDAAAAITPEFVEAFAQQEMQRL